MKQKSLSEGFQTEWEAFLCQREHEVGYAKGIGCVLQSGNAEGKRYRWLLFIARGKSKTLNRFELEDLKHHLRRARSLSEIVYVVVRFEKYKGFAK